MSDDLLRVRQHIESMMPLLERPPTGRIPYPYLAPASSQFYAQGLYTWDHFHMGLRFAEADKPAYLRSQVDNVLHYQRENGFAPSTLHPSIDPSDSTHHAQPFLMRAANHYVQRTMDVDWLSVTLPKLEKYLGYYESVHRVESGLFVWDEPYMSGIDNDVATAFFPNRAVVSCDLNAWIYLEYLAAAQLMRFVEDWRGAGKYEWKAGELKSLINASLWHEEAGSFSALHGRTGQHQLHYKDPFLDDQVGAHSFQSCSNLIPLYAGIPDTDRARRMIEKYVLSEEHFLSKFGIRSLSRSSNFYNNAVWGNPPRFGNEQILTNSNWQGPVWIPINYFVFHALVRYGFPGEAEDLRQRTLHLLASSLKSLGSFAENFDAETGVPLYASDFASWNILADCLAVSSSEFPTPGEK